MIEWLDRTAEVNAEKEIGAIVEAAAAGDFTKRIAEAGKAGFFLEMARGLNAILGTSEQALGEISPHPEGDGRGRPQPRPSRPISRACSRS